MVSSGLARHSSNQRRKIIVLNLRAKGRTKEYKITKKKILLTSKIRKVDGIYRKIK